MSLLRHLAMIYATELAVPVFPLRPGTKIPATAHGFKDATTDPEQIQQWWRDMPDANIGMPTGVKWDVLDFDRKPDGPDAVADVLPRLNDEALLTGVVAIAATRNGGRHLFYPASGLGGGSLPKFGLDFKALGGYVVMPGSLVPSDYADLPGRYVWTDPPSADRAGNHAHWTAIKALLAPPRPRASGGARGSAAALLRKVSEAQEGNRNDLLFWAACRAYERGPVDEQAFVDAAMTAGLPEHEAMRTIRSAAEKVGEVDGQDD